ncbi:hypothetical protein AGMMS49992_14780 [Clostridia bacterium]|nr:hypothetical protein AGMMS49992_14780 [Clostridia bacterium]
MSYSCCSSNTGCCTTNTCNAGASCCCGTFDEPWVTGTLDTPVGSIPTISTRPTLADMLGAWKVRWGIGRMNYTIDPGLYAIGNPNADAPVLVGCDYKLSFDTLRKELRGLDCWLLILDTKGVNVWCASGKGTFGTDELVHRIEDSELAAVVSHKRLVLPQLGASGVNGYEVKRRTGFDVSFGPVRACDIKEFISAGFNATDEMRTVRFTAWDRLKLTPIEIVTAARHAVVVFGVLFIINLFAANPFDLSDFVALVGAALMGTFVTPLLLPYVPVKPFALKGEILGLIWTAITALLFGWFSRATALLLIGYILLLPAVSAWYAMNFTGSTTYTSPSGVQKEMKAALPFMAGASLVGVVLVLINRIFD